MTSAAGAELEPIWASLLAKALEGKNLKELLSNVGAGGAGPATGAPAAAAAGGAADDAPKEEEKKEEEKEESDDDMVRVDLYGVLTFAQHLFECRVSGSSTSLSVSLSYCSLVSHSITSHTLAADAYHAPFCALSSQIAIKDRENITISQLQTDKDVYPGGA